MSSDRGEGLSPALEKDEAVPTLSRNAASACLGETCCCTQRGDNRKSVLDVSRPLLNQNNCSSGKPKFILEAVMMYFTLFPLTGVSLTFAISNNKATL